jgi:hypothetical protein
MALGWYAKENFYKAIRNYQKAVKIDPQNLQELIILLGYLKFRRIA